MPTVWCIHFSVRRLVCHLAFLSSFFSQGYEYSLVYFHIYNLYKVTLNAYCYKSLKIEVVSFSMACDSKLKELLLKISVSFLDSYIHIQVYALYSHFDVY